jgi:phage recombination protein Bet
VTSTTAEAPPQEQQIPTTDEIPEPEGVVTLGSLTLEPNQTRLTPEQKAALSAITNANPDDERARPHLRVFLHVCQRMNVDPWRRQAYLIQRGEGDKAKFTIQVGIDGYRTIAARTRLLVGSATWLWTGDDDDPACWRYNEATGVMQRVWYDEWPESRGYPGAAKAVIRHYDAFGQMVVSDAVAHWGMYAPLYPKFEWQGAQGSRRKVPVVGEDGTQIMELGEMWQKGFHHMLAKCSEALVLRKVFPDEFAGTVTFEEMHRADMEEKAREERERAAQRKEAFARAKAAQTAPGAPQEPAAAPEPPTEPGKPADATAEQQEPVDGTTGEVLDEKAARAAWLVELGWQAEQMGNTPAGLASRFVRARRQNIEDFPLNALAPMVHGFRSMIVEKLRGDESRRAEAERYAVWASDESAPVIADLDAVLSGTGGEDAGEPGDVEDAEIVDGAADSEAVAAAEPTTAEPAPDAQAPEVAHTPEAEQEVDGPHEFMQDKRRKSNPECQAPGCGFYRDDPIHTVADLEAGVGEGPAG